MPLPRKLLEQGVRDMVRICDGRMSGTAYGTVVLHVSPEAAAGGPLGKVCDGDLIVLDVAGRRVDVDIPDEELKARQPSSGDDRGVRPASPRVGVPGRRDRPAGRHGCRPRLPGRFKRRSGLTRVSLTFDPRLHRTERDDAGLPPHSPADALEPPGWVPTTWQRALRGTGVVRTLVTWVTPGHGYLPPAAPGGPSPRHGCGSRSW